jgi:hypothetical protein
VTPGGRRSDGTPTGPAPPSPTRAGAAADAGDLVETQVERTELAWARTALACAGLAAVSAHLAGDDIGLALALALGTVVALPGLVASWWRIRGLRAHPEPAAPRAAGVALLAGSVAAVDVVVLVLLAR